MTRTLTVSYPALRTIALATAALLTTAILLLVGVRWGMRIAADPLGTALDGDLQEVHVSNGTIYLGRVIQVGSDELLLAGAAVVRAADETEAATGDFVVQALVTDPFGIGGPVAIERSQVVLVGSVDLESAIAAAYQHAFAEPSTESNASPSP